MNAAAKVDRMLVGMLWGTSGLERGYSLLSRVTTSGIGVAALAVAIMCAQAWLLPQNDPWRPWPVKLVGLLNFIAFLAAIACYRRKWAGGILVVLAVVALYTAVIAIGARLGGLLPRLSQQQAVSIAREAIAASAGLVTSGGEPTVLLADKGGSDGFAWTIQFRSDTPKQLIFVEVQDATGEPMIERFVELSDAADSR